MKNPYINALIAAAYIVVIVWIIGTVTSFQAIQETLIIPMIMLGLFVLSAAIMGVLFIYQPASLFLEDKKREAIVFFSKTVGTFALSMLIIIFIIITVLV